jgi:phosphoglycolate phosphatase
MKGQAVWQAVIFDVDGTLYQTERVAIPAFRRTFESLRREGLYQGAPPSEEKILSCFGMTIPELWETLLPDASMDVRDRANERLASYEIELMKEGEGRLYPSVVEVLSSLHKQKIRLYVASNGEERYVNTVLETTGIAPLIHKAYAAGTYKTEKKSELVALLLRAQNLQRAVMVGDRRSDIEAGRDHGLPTVGCDFGFADADELVDATVLIKRFDQLPDVLFQLVK